ncbi:hypothetical protein D3C74_237090 [compost metagenome]
MTKAGYISLLSREDDRILKIRRIGKKEARRISSVRIYFISITYTTLPKQLLGNQRIKIILKGRGITMIPRDNEHIRIISEVKALDARIQTTFALGRFLITWNEYVKDDRNEKPIKGTR